VLTYEPGASLAHTLDPRTKLLMQAGFVAAAYAHTSPRGAAVLTVVAMGLLVCAHLHPFRVAYAYRYALPILAVTSLVAGATLNPPWLRPDTVFAGLLTSYRILLVLAVSAFYVHTTSARESRAAVQHTVPGRPGQFLGIGISLVFRFLPVLLDDLRRIRDASWGRLGDQQPVRERMELVAVAGFNRAFSRGDHLALALQARCLAWNPTLPELAFGRRDVAGVAAAVSLTAWAAAPLVLG